MQARKRTVRNLVAMRAPVPRHTRPSMLQDASSKPNRLFGSLCAVCNSCYYPSQTICVSCGCDLMEEVPLSRQGRLETFVIIRHAIPNYRGPLPYAIGTVRLPEGIRLSVLLHDCPLEDLRTGMEVELSPVKLREDRAGNEAQIQAFLPLCSA